MFDTGVISSGAPDALSFELFLLWIGKIRLVYQDLESNNGKCEALK